MLQGLSDKQEDNVPQRADGGCESAAENGSTVSADVLANGSQSSNVDQQPGGVDEHG